MDCEAVHRLIDADVDGELDLVRHLEVEAHMRDCSACARLRDGACSWQSALREALPRHAAPAGLAERIERAVSAGSTLAARQRESARTRPALWRAAGIAAAVLVGLLVGREWGAAGARAPDVFTEAVADHVRSLQADHLTDVLSSDRHTVKPWFAGKLDFSPPVLDLSAAGFVLVGGRLDRIDGHAAAVLVFRRREHAINLFVWPAGGTPLAEQRRSLDGYHLRSWSQGGFDCLAVSELADAELAELVAAFRAAN
jgi:anti-sigma factor RsiW